LRSAFRDLDGWLLDDAAARRRRGSQRSSSYTDAGSIAVAHPYSDAFTQSDSNADTFTFSDADSITVAQPYPQTIT
jgi:hypothetical protein